MHAQSSLLCLFTSHAEFPAWPGCHGACVDARRAGRSFPLGSAVTSFGPDARLLACDVQAKTGTLGATARPAGPHRRPTPAAAAPRVPRRPTGARFWRPWSRRARSGRATLTSRRCRTSPSCRPTRWPMPCQGGGRGRGGPAQPLIGGALAGERLSCSGLVCCHFHVLLQWLQCGSHDAVPPFPVLALLPCEAFSSTSTPRSAAGSAAWGDGNPAAGDTSRNTLDAIKELCSRVAHS